MKIDYVCFAKRALRALFEVAIEPAVESFLEIMVPIAWLIGHATAIVLCHFVMAWISTMIPESENLIHFVDDILFKFTLIFSAISFVVKIWKYFVGRVNE